MRRAGDAASVTNRKGKASTGRCLTEWKEAGFSLPGSLLFFPFGKGKKRIVKYVKMQKEHRVLLDKI